MDINQAPPGQAPTANQLGDQTTGDAAGPAQQQDRVSPPQAPPAVPGHVVRQPPLVGPPGRPVRSTVRTVMTILIDILFVIALALLVRLFMSFFQPLMATALYRPLIGLTDPLVLPLGVARIATPFKGFFEVNTAITILAILVVEYLLAVVRRNA